ncbi:MAG: HisA/HisF-related TIM barrel protein [Promethearchaeota archaeon]
MKGFRVIPVVDIFNSKAVHAKKGERTKYKLLESKLFQSTNPVEIIKKIKNEFNFYEVYIADLDSIINKNPNLQILNEILDTSNIEVILDPGIVDIEDVLYFSGFKIKNLILGLETIRNIKIISQSLRILSKNRIIISIDMYKGKIISNIKDIRNQNPIHVIEKIESLGIKSIILLDLFRVGQKIGGIPPLYLDVLSHFNGDILVGGGIKNIRDVLDYKDLNFSGVLIATSLYDGTINIEMLRNII